MTRPVGRPPIGRSVHLRLPAELLAVVDAYAKRERVTRAGAVRLLLATALDEGRSPSADR